MSLPSSGSMNKPSKNCFFPASCQFLAWHIFQPWTWRQHIPWKCLLTCSRLHGVYILEDGTLHNHLCENLKSYISREGRGSRCLQMLVRVSQTTCVTSQVATVFSSHSWMLVLVLVLHIWESSAINLDQETLVSSLPPGMFLIVIWNRPQTLPTISLGIYHSYCHCHFCFDSVRLVTFILKNVSIFLHGSERQNDPSNEQHLPIASTFLYSTRECHECRYGAVNTSASFIVWRSE
jgi:hypothetical protein